MASAILATLLIVGASYAPTESSFAALGVVVVLLAGLALGWGSLLGFPGKAALGVVLLIAGAGASALAIGTGSGPTMDWLAPCVAAGVLLAFLAQLLRGTGGAMRLEGTAIGATGVLIAVLGSGWVALDGLGHSTPVVVVAGISMVGAGLIGAIRWPDRIVAPLGWIVAVLLGGVSSVLFADVDLVPALVLGAVTGAVIVAFRAILVSEGGPADNRGAIAAGIVPVLVCGAMAWFVETLLVS
ncbi:hypothetical protein E9229_000198 [Paeniglutamicibacter cryotolerans]|uniref:Permease n=2 Tax=Paeniglutamicibacter cryotolerans TaxID=670079 RepID=A0A839QEG4_9MICC|nr:hypothetical protein [Paeniglutamicibacter cryotolerans]